jgi:oligoendopeptidase F
MTHNISHNYYKELIDLQNVDGVEAEIRSLLDVPIESISDLEKWLKDEKDLTIKIQEAMTGHEVDFYRNTENADIKSIYLHDQQVIQPILMNYEAKLNEKFCTLPFLNQLDEKRYGLLQPIYRCYL